MKLYERKPAAGVLSTKGRMRYHRELERAKAALDVVRELLASLVP